MGSVGDRLKRERVRLGYSVRKFAEAAGVATSTQMNYESNEREPRSEYYNRISRLGAEIFWIMRGLPEDDDLREKRRAQYPPEIREMNENYEMVSPAVQAAVRAILKDAADKKRAAVAEFKRACGSAVETVIDRAGKDAH